MNLKKKIFVSIVSYKDPLLTQTVQSLLENASTDNDITISILDQSHDKLVFSESNVLYMQLDPKLSKGVGWARHINSLNLTNEDFYYQIDSHAVFDSNWDRYLIADFEKYQKRYNTNKIALSSASNEFIMNDKDIQKTNYDQPHTFITKFSKHSNITNEDRLVSVHSYLHERILDDQELPAVHMHAGNFFTHSDFIKDVGISPEFFFDGEEQYLTMTLFFNDYKLFHHSEVHNYHFTYTPGCYFTNPWRDKERNVNEIQIFSKKSKNFLNRYIDLLSDDQLDSYYKFSGINYKTNTIDEEVMCDYDPGVMSNAACKQQIYPNFSIFKDVGLKYLLMETDDIISNVVQTTGSFCKVKYEDAYRLLLNTKSPVIYDIGSHFGTFSLPLSSKINSSQIYAFEIQYPIFLQLNANILLNGIKNVTAIHAAISDESKQIYIDEIEYNYSRNIGAYTLDHNIRNINQQGIEYLKEQTEVSQYKIDDLDLPKPNLIKISVCGCELNVLKGAQRTITEAKPFIIMDCWQSDFFKPYRDEILKFVISLGYSIRYTEFDYIVLTM